MRVLISLTVALTVASAAVLEPAKHKKHHKGHKCPGKFAQQLAQCSDAPAFCSSEGVPAHTTTKKETVTVTAAHGKVHSVTVTAACSGVPPPVQLYVRDSEVEVEEREVEERWVEADLEEATELEERGVDTKHPKIQGPCGMTGSAKAFKKACKCAAGAVTVTQIMTKTKQSKGKGHGPTVTVTDQPTDCPTPSTSSTPTQSSAPPVITSYPGASGCTNPATCGSYVLYSCNDSFDGECACGINASGQAQCFQDDSCAALPGCSQDSDCTGYGAFCLVDSCCGNPVCVYTGVCQNPNSGYAMFRKRHSPAPVPANAWTTTQLPKNKKGNNAKTHSKKTLIGMLTRFFA